MANLEFQPLEIHSHLEEKLYRDTDEVEVRRTEGETKNLWWTSGGPSQRKWREWTTLVPEDSFIS